MVGLTPRRGPDWATAAVGRPAWSVFLQQFLSLENVRSPFHLGDCHWRRSVQVACQKNVISSAGYKLFTETVQSSGPENIGTERPLPGLLAQRPVLSPSRITLENNGKIRAQPDRENAFARASGGETGIRTLETVSRLHAFQACAFDHSATSPWRSAYSSATLKFKG